MSTNTPGDNQPDRVDPIPEDEDSFPKTTRPEAEERREPARILSSAELMGKNLDAVPDRVDVRDFVYQPRLGALPDQLVNCAAVPEILDQGREGACTGFALAAVINFLLRQRGRGDERVSPRMLYEMARRYDEWPGEEYVGSSARGAMKGWVRHGVCSRTAWQDDQQGLTHFTPEIGVDSMRVPGGAFYRVSHKDVRDMHGALAEVGIIYVTLMVHEGWGTPGPMTTTIEYLDSERDPAHPHPPDHPAQRSGGQRPRRRVRRVHPGGVHRPELVGAGLGLGRLRAAPVRGLHAPRDRRLGCPARRPGPRRPLAAGRRRLDGRAPARDPRDPARRDPPVRRRRRQQRRALPHRRVLDHHRRPRTPLLGDDPEGDGGLVEEARAALPPRRPQRGDGRRTPDHLVPRRPARQRDLPAPHHVGDRLRRHAQPDHPGLLHERRRAGRRLARPVPRGARRGAGPHPGADGGGGRHGRSGAR